ncbi:MAG: oligosaccharide flippase family protein, partial [Oscillospiraceae bacterium]|nr:oligosaccharide flippase family protein [Oscillospiraceae bacterium]
MTDTERPSYLRGAAILGAAAVVAKIIGALFKIPLYNLLSDEATGDFNITYNVYALLLTISYAGIPVAMSRLVSTSRTLGNTRQMRKYFRVALPAFSVVGIAVSLVMFIFAGQFAALMEDPNAVYGIRMLSPAVFLCCVISVYEGYFQGHGDMLPTAVKQLIEVTSKLLFGLVIAWLLIRGGAPDEKVASGAITGVVFGLAIALPVLIGYKRRAKREPLAGTARSNLGTLASILKVSVPITLGASFMSIMALLDSKVVMSRLQSASGAGFDLDTARGMFGVYAQCLTLYNLMPSLITAVTISVVPAISAAIAAKRRSEARA